MQEFNDPELKSLEARLRQWEPADASAGRTAMLYEAGRVQGQQEARPTSLTGILSVLALCLGVVLGAMARPGRPPVAETDSTSPSPVQSEEFASPQGRVPQPVDPQSYLAMTTAFERYGDLMPTQDVVSEPASPSSPVLTPRSPIE